MSADDGIIEEDPADTEDDDGMLERTDIDADEEQDGDVDAEGASAIPRRND